MNKTEYINFLTYLKNKDEIIIDTAFSYSPLGGTYDYCYRSQAIVEMIKALSVEDAYYAIGRIYVTTFGKNVKQKLYPRLYYVEDVMQYIISLGYDEKESLRYTKAIASGFYKRYQRTKPSLFPNDFYEFAKAVKTLSYYDQLTHYFPSEYRLFKEMTTLA